MLLNEGKYKEHQLLSPKTIALMTTNHVEDKFNEPGMGFGLGFGVRLDLADPKTLGTVEQFSWSGAYNTYFFIDPKENLVGILMMQFAPYTGSYNLMFRQLVYQAITNAN
jgi:CubicO group peptidase (beta-lactamase class C family)